MHPSLVFALLLGCTAVLNHAIATHHVSPLSLSRTHPSQILLKEIGRLDIRIGRRCRVRPTGETAVHGAGEFAGSSRMAMDRALGVVDERVHLCVASVCSCGLPLRSFTPVGGGYRAVLLLWCSSSLQAVVVVVLL